MRLPILMFLLLLSGCATVAPQQRAILADPTMQFDAGVTVSREVGVLITTEIATQAAMQAARATAAGPPHRWRRSRRRSAAD